MVRYLAIFLVIFSGSAIANDDLPVMGNEGQMPLQASTLAADDTITGSLKRDDKECTILDCIKPDDSTKKVVQTNSSP